MSLISIGVVLVIAGLLAWAGVLGWIGRLPGDIRFERGSARIYIPIVSMLIVSAALTLILHFVRRWF